MRPLPILLLALTACDPGGGPEDTTDLTALQARLDVLEGEQGAFAERIAERIAELEAALAAARSEAAARAADLEAEVEALGSAVDELDVGDLREEVASHADRLTAVEGRVDAAETALEALAPGVVESQLQDHATRLAALEGAGLATQAWVNAQSYATSSQLGVVSGAVDALTVTVSGVQTAMGGSTSRSGTCRRR